MVPSSPNASGRSPNASPPRRMPSRASCEVHGRTVDIGGYYHPDIERMAELMRPSATLNATLEEFGVEPVTSGDM